MPDRTGAPEVPEVRGADLCWGQRYVWLRYQQMPPEARHEAHIVVGCPLPEGLTLPALRTALDHLVRRHEGLRTVYDPCAPDGPRQRVQPPRPLPLRVADAGRDATPTAAEVVTELTRTPFDLAREWPIRACAVTAGGIPVRLTLVLNHLAFDDWSITRFQREFEALLGAVASRRRVRLPAVPYQPADLAAAEAEVPAEVRERARGFWQREARRLPADVLAGRRTRPDPAAGLPAAHAATLASPELLGTVREIASRLRLWPSAVHLAAFAVGMTAYTGEPVTAHRWLTSHREGGARMDVLTCMFSPLVVTADLSGDPGFGEAAARVAEAVDQVQRHTDIPYDELAELVAREGFRRGVAVRAGSEANFLSHGDRECGARRQRVVRTAPPTAWATAGTDTYLRVDEWADGVTVALHALGSVMDADAVDALLLGYARLLEAHRDAGTDLPLSEAVALFGFGPAPARPRTVRVGPDTVDLDATETVLREHPAVRSAAVRTDGGRLSAEVVADVPLDAAELRRHVMSRVCDRPGARCPDVFTSAASPAVSPAVPPGAAARSAPTPAEDALTQAVAGANALDAAEVDLSAAYTAVGGRLLRVPLVLAELAARGWTGPLPAAFQSPRPLASLAEDLAPDGAAPPADDRTTPARAAV